MIVMTFDHDPDDRWPHTFKRTLIHGDTFKSPVTQMPVKFDVDSMAVAAKRFNTLWLRYGEYEPVTVPTLDYSKLIVMCNYVAFTSDLELQCEFVTMQNQFGLNLKKILVKMERDNANIKVDFIPRLWGNMLEDGTFYVNEIIAVDVKFPPELLNFVLQTKNIFTN